MRGAVTALLGIAICGCTPQAPPDYTPELCAACGVAAIVGAPQPPPGPDTEECTNCGGTGKLGAGTVEVDCPVCGGDGILSAAVPSTPSAPVSPATTGTPGPAAVYWRADYEDAKAESRQTGKPLFVLVTTAQCAACTVLKTYLRTADIAAFVNSNFVPYNANPSEVRVAIYPTQIVWKDGREVTRRQGAPRNAEDYLRIFQQDYAKAKGL